MIPSPKNFVVCFSLSSHSKSNSVLQSTEQSIIIMASKLHRLLDEIILLGFHSTALISFLLPFCRMFPQGKFELKQNLYYLPLGLQLLQSITIIN